MSGVCRFQYSVEIYFSQVVINNNFEELVVSKIYDVLTISLEYIMAAVKMIVER